MRANQSSAFVWTVAISGSPTGGSYDLLFDPGSMYSGTATATIAWNDVGSAVASKLQTAIRTIAGLSAAGVSASADAGTSPNLTHTLTVSGVTNPTCDGTIDSEFIGPAQCCVSYKLTGLSIVIGPDTYTEIIFFAYNSGDDDGTCILVVQIPGLSYDYIEGLGIAPGGSSESYVTFSTTDGCDNSATLPVNLADAGEYATGTATVSVP